MGIQVDCRRTDRNQPIYAVPTSTASKHQESVNKVSERKSEKSEWEDDEEEGGMASLNRESPPPLQTSLATDDGLNSTYRGTAYHSHDIPYFFPRAGLRPRSVFSYSPHPLLTSLSFCFTGMSDLLSPIYVVFDANEGDAFWGLVGVMKMMVRRPFLLHLYL